MANESLATPIEIESSLITINILPSNFSETYKRIVLSNGNDLIKVAGRASEAGQEAYDAQVKNEEQDITLSDHEMRVSSAESTIKEHSARLDNHEGRIASAEVMLIDHEMRIQQSEAKITHIEDDVDYLTSEVIRIGEDYLSKSDTESQSLMSPLDVTSSYSIGGIKVIGHQITGFTPSVGTASKSGLNANRAFPVSAEYDQAEIKAMADALTETRKSYKSLEDAMRKHGLID